MNIETQVTRGDAAPTLASLMAGMAVPAGEIASLNRYLSSAMSLDRAEAEALFDLERAALTRSEAWTTYFVEAVTDHVVWGARPTGRLDEIQAVWLLDQVDRRKTPAGLALLVNVLDEAQSYPAWFAGAVRARAAAGWPGLARDATTSPQTLSKAA